MNDYKKLTAHLPVNPDKSKYWGMVNNDYFPKKTLKGKLARFIGWLVGLFTI